jgi:hypothetical protein
LVEAHPTSNQGLRNEYDWIGEVYALRAVEERRRVGKRTPEADIRSE